MPASLPVRAIQSVQVTMPTPTITNGQPVDWVPTGVTKADAGFFVIYMYVPGNAPIDVTYYRNVPTKLESYTLIDPFTYGTAVITFPQITVFEDLDALGFLGTEDAPANVDIFWYSAAAGDKFLSTLTGQYTKTYGTPTKVWEGFIASRDVGTDGLVVQCQGALFQLDRYKQKPFYPRRPYVLERLMYEMMYPYYEPGNQGHPFAKPNLRTLPLLTRWPAAWSKITPPRVEGEPNLYTPVIPPNRLWTGYTTRNTGSWENTLTGFFQDMLAIMYTTDDSGVTAGDQWALRCEQNRQPVLEIRERARPADFEVWVGTPGVEVSVTADFTTKENILYGEGTGTDGTLWRNVYFTGAWNRTEYEPLAYDAGVYPPVPVTLPGFETANPSFDANRMVHESKTQFPSGVTQDGATSAMTKRLPSAKDAGLQGTLTLRTDPLGLLRWHVRAGQTVKIKGLRGSSTTGINFHIAEVVVNVEDMSVECKIDTKYRDLLTLEEARARAIDPMTPSKLLQVNRRSLMVEDILAPWDYHSGSGYIPQTARYGKSTRNPGWAGVGPYDFFKDMPQNTKFPWSSWTSKAGNRPSDYTGDVSADGKTQGPYLVCNANASSSRNKWVEVPILTAQKVTIRRIEVAAYNAAGQVIPVEFHLSFHHTPIDTSGDALDYPHTGSDYSPFAPGHWESTDAQGVPTPDQAPPDTHIIGWGNELQRAGYWKGLYSEGKPKTGLFVDDGTWDIDNTQYVAFEADMSEGERVEAVTVYASFWCDHTSDVYFLGRMWKQEQAGQ